MGLAGERCLSSVILTNSIYFSGVVTKGPADATQAYTPLLEEGGPEGVGRSHFYGMFVNCGAGADVHEGCMSGVTP